MTDQNRPAPSWSSLDRQFPLPPPESRSAELQEAQKVLHGLTDDQCLALLRYSRAEQHARDAEDLLARETDPSHLPRLVEALGLAESEVARTTEVAIATFGGDRSAAEFAVRQCSLLEEALIPGTGGMRL